jgi:hypothetical protein
MVGVWPVDDAMQCDHIGRSLPTHLRTPSEPRRRPGTRRRIARQGVTGGGCQTAGPWKAST